MLFVFHSIPITFKLPRMVRRFLILAALLALPFAAPAQFEEELLPAEEAFAFDAFVEQGEVVTSWTIADGYYMYQDKFAVLSNTEGAVMGDPAMPPGEMIEDPLFGEVAIYTGFVQFRTPIVADASLDAVAISAWGQGCNKPVGICYPPIQNDIELKLPAFISTAQAQSMLSEAPDGAESESSTTIFWLIISAFGAGLLLTFTPCVLPLIPILSSIIAGDSKQGGSLRGGMLATTYVLGTVVSYAFIGAVAGATGDQLNAYFQNVWAIGSISAIFVLMSLSMFGLYEIRLPSAFESRVHQSTSRIGGGKFSAVFFLGMISALIVSACVSPLLISALGIAIAKGDPALGAAMMTSMALGMGAVLIAIGFGLGVALPKAGPWMDRIKQTFGVLLLGVAIYLIGFIPEAPVLILWGILLVVCGVFLGATQTLPEGASGWRYLAKGLGLVMMIWGVLALVGSMYGERSILRPLPSMAAIIGNAGIAETDLVAAQKSPFQKVASMDQLNQYTEQAQASGKPVVYDFYADWCLDCIRLDSTTFKDPAVVAMLNDGFVGVKIDVTDPNNEFGRAIRRKYKIFGPPALVVTSTSSEPVVQYGYLDSQEMLDLLDRI